MLFYLDSSGVTIKISTTWLAELRTKMYSTPAAHGALGNVDFTASHQLLTEIAGAHLVVPCRMSESGNFAKIVFQLARGRMQPLEGLGQSMGRWLSAF